MIEVARQSPANPVDPVAQPGLRRTFWLLARLYALRRVNRLPKLGASRADTRPVGGKRHWSRAVLFFAASWCFILWAMSGTAERALQQVARHHGADAAAGSGILITCLALYALLVLALLVDFDSQRGATAEESEWLTTLPAPTWVLYACKTCEQALVQPAAWLSVFPMLAGLAAFTGWGWLAPLVALTLALPLFLCAGILAGLGGALRARLGHVHWFRALTWLLPVLALLALSGLALLDQGWLPAQPLALAADVRWLPLAEPARLLLSRSSPGALLGWAVAYLVEAGGLIAAGTWALSRVYRAESMGATTARGGARAARGTKWHLSQSVWLRRLGPVALREALLLRKHPGRAATVLLFATVANAAALLAARLAPGHPLNRPGNVLLNIGALVVFALAPRLLEKERGALTLLASLPRPLSATFAQQTFLIVLAAIALAAPTAVYSCLNLPASAAAVDLARGLVGVIVVAVLNTALWMRHAGDPQPSPWRAMLEFLVVIAAAAPSALSGSEYTLAIAAVALMGLLLVWSSASVRLACGGSPIHRARQGLTLKQGVSMSLAAMLLPPLPGGLVTVAGGSPGTQLLVVQGTLAALVGSALLIDLEAPSSIRRAIGVASGKGVPVSIREGALWAAVASANAWLWLEVPALWATTSAPPQSGAFNPVAQLAHSPTLLVVGLCIVAPVAEETVFRGFLYGSLRRQWDTLPCATASALAFASLHDQRVALPLFGLGLCAALARERSGSLLAPILTHMAYNAFIIGLQLWG